MLSLLHDNNNIKNINMDNTEQQTKDLEYYKNNAEENYATTPISVLRYITELEEKTFTEQDVIKIFNMSLGSQGIWSPELKKVFIEELKRFKDYS
jgi:hypothetical protein